MNEALFMNVLETINELLKEVEYHLSVHLIVFVEIVSECIANAKLHLNHDV